MNLHRYTFWKTGTLPWISFHAMQLLPATESQADAMKPGEGKYPDDVIWTLDPAIPGASLSCQLQE